MASILARNLVKASRSSLVPRTAVCARSYSAKIPPYYDPAEGKTVSKDASMPDELGGAVGIERWELIQKARGIEDPFMLQGLKRVNGTKDNPQVIDTVGESRVIGCACEPDSVIIRFSRLHVGETKRCYCGHYFKLISTADLANA